MQQSYEEVDARGTQPFTPPASSRLQAAPADLAKALGVDLADEEKTEQDTAKPPVDLAAQQKANEEAEKVIQNRSARIQETSEELYRIEERAALRDASHLLQLIDSKDPLDRKNAEKILKRNAETFGAPSIEEYRSVLAAAQISDPTEKKIAEQDAKIRSLQQRQKNSEWSDWKQAQSVGTDISAAADEIHATYPDMSYGDVLALARGRGGFTPQTSQKRAASAAVGGTGAPEQEEFPIHSRMAKTMLKNPDSTLKFAKGYLRSLTS